MNDDIQKPPPANSRGDVIGIAQRVTLSGPLPPPEILEKYNNVIPGLADRIVYMAEQEQRHAHQIQQEQLKLEMSAHKQSMNYFGRGQWFAFILAIVFLFVSAGLAMQGHEVTASALGGSTIVGIVSVYIFGYRRKTPARE